MLKLAVDSIACRLINHHTLLRGQVDEYLRQLVRVIVVEVDGLREPALQSGIRVDEGVHLLGVASNDAHELTSVVFQSLQQGVDGLAAKRVVVVGTQGIGLVDEEYATQGRVYQLVGLDGSLTRIARYQLRAVGLYQLPATQYAQRAEHVGHDACNGGLACSGIAREHVVLSLEGVRLPALDLQVQEGSKVLDFLLHGVQADQTVQAFQAIVIVHLLGSLVGDVLLHDGHQLLIGHRSEVAVLQSLSLFLTYLVKERAHGAAIGKVLVARLVQLPNHLAGQGLGLWRKHIAFLLGKDHHNLQQFLGRVVFQVQEIVKAAAHAGVHPEQIIHFGLVACGDDDKLSPVILHAFHQRFQSLRTLIVALAGLAQRG